MRPAFTYTRLQPTQRWRRLPDGTWGRDWIARRSDNQVRLVTYRDVA